MATQGAPTKFFAPWLGRFLAAEDGPTAVEYAVLLAMIFLVCFTAIELVGVTVSRSFTDTSNKLPAP